jgi:hypothetical protein
MKFGVVVLTIAVTSMGLTVPVLAQIRNPAQDFFWQGRQRLEREIQVLQENPSSSDESLQEAPSKPLLEVRPARTSDTNQQQNEVETPQQQPEQVGTPRHQRIR